MSIHRVKKIIAEKPFLLNTDLNYGETFTSKIIIFTEGTEFSLPFEITLFSHDKDGLKIITQEPENME